MCAVLVVHRPVIILRTALYCYPYGFGKPLVIFEYILVETTVPKKVTITMTTIAIKARMSAYSTNP